MNSTSRFPHNAMEGGWVMVRSGESAVSSVGGEFRDTDNQLVWLTGFGYFDFRDRAGHPIPAFPAFTECFEVQRDVQSWLVDMDPSTPAVEMRLYALETALGPLETAARSRLRWLHRGLHEGRFSQHRAGGDKGHRQYPVGSVLESKSGYARRSGAAGGSLGAFP